MLLSHTVLSELYQEKLVTEDEVKRLKGKRRSLPDRVVLVQFTKPLDVIAKTVAVLDKYIWTQGDSKAVERLVM